jgi:DNA polymerase III epsilon subunit-like protein
MRVLVFDTETTGLPKSRVLNPLMFHLWPHIVQFSYVIYDTDLRELVTIKDFIIRLSENIVIPDESIKIHGITNEIMRNQGVDISIAFESFFKDASSADLLIGHNVEFDLNMIKIELLRFINNKTIEHSAKTVYKDMLYSASYVLSFRCTMKETTEFCSILTKSKKGDTYKKYPSLAELYHKLYEKTPQNLHNSLHDVLVTLICFMKFQHNTDIEEDCVEIKQILKNVGVL